MRFFFIDKPAAAGSRISISGSDARHIHDVLRKRAGDMIGLLDGQGFEYRAQIERLSPQGVELTILQADPSCRESDLQITIAQALLKEKQMEGLLRPLTELGVFQWIPFTATRSVPRPKPEAMAGRVQRWEKIVQAALKQCRRGRVMEIVSPPKSFDALMAESAAWNHKIVFWERESLPLEAALKKPDAPVRKILIMLGPEGGFTESEIITAREHGFIPVGLGPRILKADTATIAACTLVQYLYGDMGR